MIKRIMYIELEELEELIGWDLQYHLYQPFLRKYGFMANGVHQEADLVVTQILLIEEVAAFGIMNLRLVINLFSIYNALKVLDNNS